MLRFLKIHTVPTAEEGSTWLQLFFDLVYVATLVEVGNRLSYDLSLEGVFTFAVLLLIIWWSWLEFVEYGRRYPIDDIGQRILTVLYMVFMLIMAFEIHNLTGVTSAAFIITFGFSKFVLALMYGRVWIYFPMYRHLTRGQAIAFILVGLLWITFAIIFPFNLWLWLLVFTLGALAPSLVQRLDPSGGADLPQPPIKYHFTLHRFGELTIIVLGEFFIKLVTSAAGRELTTTNNLIGAGLLGISVSLWWLYFDHLEHASLTKAGTRIRVWTYSHFPFMAAIVAYGVVGNKIFAAQPFIPLDDAQRLFFTVALATAILAFGLIEWASKEKDEPLSRSPQPWFRLAGAASILALGLFGHSLNVGWLVMLVVAVFLLLVGLDVFERLRRPDQDYAQVPM